MSLTPEAIPAEMLECARGYADYIQEQIKGEDAVVLLEQLRTLEKTRLTRYLGTLGEAAMRRIDRALETYLRKGYSREWINQRLQAIQVRKELTDEWQDRGVKKGSEFAILTDEITRAWSGMSTREYKTHKGLKKENLRDNMTNEELVLNMLAELSTTSITKVKDPKNLEENMQCAAEGGEVARVAKEKLESKTGRSVVSPISAKRFFLLQKPEEEE